MDEKPLIGFGIITYNRDYLLDYVLEDLINAIDNENIPIYIFDNCSEDQTALVCEKYKKQYDKLYYKCHSKNMGPDSNFAYALTHINTQYIWMLTDGTRVLKQSIKDAIRILKRDEYQIVVTGVIHRTETLQDKIYHNKDDLLKTLGWHMTYLGSLIYNQKIVNEFNYQRYIGSRFLQTGIIFEYLTQHEPYVSFENSIKVDTYPLSKRGHWDDRTVEIFAKDWFAFIMSLPVQYKIESKYTCIRSHDENTHIFGLVNLASLRSVKAIRYGQIKKYKKFLKESTTKRNYMLAHIICVIPPCVCLAAKYVYKKIKKRDFYVDRGESLVKELKPRL